MRQAKEEKEILVCGQAVYLWAYKMAECIIRFNDKEIKQIKERALIDKVNYEELLINAAEQCFENGDNDQISHNEIISDNEVLIILVCLPENF